MSENKKINKRAFILTQELMTRDVFTFNKNTRVSEAIIILATNKISGAPVIDSENKVIGMFTESDILRYFNVRPNQKLSLLNLPIIYSRKLHVVNENTPLYLVQRTFIENGLRALPVVDKNNKLKGIISRRDLLKYIFVVNKHAH